jgi:hypothetical protein
MPAGMQAIFAGDHFWHMPADVKIEIGPAVPIALPRRYLEDTTRYSGSVTLRHLPEGGYVPDGYVAGIPFPQPGKVRPSHPTKSSMTLTTITRRACSVISHATILWIHTGTLRRPRQRTRSIRN